MLSEQRGGNQTAYTVLRNAEQETCLVTPQRKAKDSNEKESVEKQKTVNVFFTFDFLKAKDVSFSLSTKKNREMKKTFLDKGEWELKLRDRGRSCS